MTATEDELPMEAELLIGPQALSAYSRLSYTMWHALAEFIDNSTQSRKNYEGVIDDVLREEGSPLVVDIVHDKVNRRITITDNSIGMTRQDLTNALRIAHPTADSTGRSKYGMGMKTAACWIGKHWRVITSEWGSGEEWTADVDVEAIAQRGAKVPLSVQTVGTDTHFTTIEISDLNRNIQKRTEENIRAYLGSMYRNDIIAGELKLLCAAAVRVRLPQGVGADRRPGRATGRARAAVHQPGADRPSDPRRGLTDSASNARCPRRPHSMRARSRSSPPSRSATARKAP